MDFRMSIGFRFNRPLTERDYLSPGGYEIKTKYRSFAFDFEDYEGRIDEKNRDTAHFSARHPDRSAFPCIDVMTERDIRNIKSLVECYVYTGEENETDLRTRELLYMIFDVDGKSIRVPDHVLAAWNLELIGEGV